MPITFINLRDPSTRRLKAPIQLEPRGISNGPIRAVGDEQHGEEMAPRGGPFKIEPRGGPIKMEPRGGPIKMEPRGQIKMEPRSPTLDEGVSNENDKVQPQGEREPKLKPKTEPIKIKSNGEEGSSGDTESIKDDAMTTTNQTALPNESVVVEEESNNENPSPPLPVHASIGPSDAMCPSFCSLESAVHHTEAASYGIMFQMEAKAQPITIETVEIKTLVLSEEQTSVHVQVYTKTGAYQGFHRVPNAWKKIADLYVPTVRGSNKLLIPAYEFKSFKVEPFSKQALYVTLPLPELEYSNAANGKNVGDTYTENQHMKILVGSSLLEYPFSRSIALVEPRIFSGAIHYSRTSLCSNPENAETRTTSVPFTFVVRYDKDSIEYNAAVQQVNALVTSVLKGILGQDVLLRTWVQQHALQIVDSNTGTALNVGEAVSDCQINNAQTCTGLVTRVTLNHSELLDHGDIHYHLLQYRMQVTDAIDQVSHLDATYVGSIPIVSNLIIQLDGVPPDQIMAERQIRYMEERTRNFFRQRLSRSLMHIGIFRTKITNQENLGSNKRKQKGVSSSSDDLTTASQARTLQESDPVMDYFANRIKFRGSKSGVSIDITVTITAEYTPPPVVNFEILTEDTIDDFGETLKNDLVARRGLPGFLSAKEAAFFANLTDIRARPVNGTDRHPRIRHASSLNTPIHYEMEVWHIVVLSILGALGLFFMSSWCLRCRRRYVEQYNKKVVKEQKGVIYSYMSSVYEVGFGNFDKGSTDAGDANKDDEEATVASTAAMQHTERVANRTESSSSFFETTNPDKKSSRHANPRVLSSHSKYHRHEREKKLSDVTGSSRRLVVVDQELPFHRAESSKSLKSRQSTTLTSKGVPIVGGSNKEQVQHKDPTSRHAVDDGFVKIDPKPKGSKRLRDAREEMWASKRSMTEDGEQQEGADENEEEEETDEERMKRSSSFVSRVSTIASFEKSMRDVSVKDFPVRKPKFKQAAEEAEKSKGENTSLASGGEEKVSVMPKSGKTIQHRKKKGE